MYVHLDGIETHLRGRRDTLDESVDGSLEAMFIREAARYYCPEYKNRAGW